MSYAGVTCGFISQWYMHSPTSFLDFNFQLLLGGEPKCYSSLVSEQHVEYESSFLKLTSANLWQTRLTIKGRRRPGAFYDRGRAAEEKFIATVTMAHHHSLSPRSRELRTLDYVSCYVAYVRHANCKLVFQFLYFRLKKKSGTEKKDRKQKQ